MADLHLAALRAESLSFRIKEFVDHKGLSIFNETIVKSIRGEAINKKMPQRYINSIRSDFDGTYLWIWVDFKGEKLEPLDEFFEEGTKRHVIKPIAKKVISWIEGGIRYFSKGHYVGGISARHVFRDGFEKSYPEFKKRLQEELQIYLKETMLFGRKD